MCGWRGTAGELVAELRAAGEAVVAGRKSLLALAIVVAIAVLREGSEVVLFLYGVAAAQGGASWSMVGGGVVGLILGSCVCLLTYFGLVTIPTRYLFGVTSTLIAFLAAGLAAQAIAFLEQADIVTALDRTVWDTSWLLSNSSMLGRALHTLIGYVDQPTAMQLVVYRGHARHHRRADEAVFRAAGAAAAHGLTTESLGRRRTAGEVIRAQRRDRYFAEIGKLRFQAFDVEANDAAAGENQRHHAGRRIAFGKFDREEIEQRAFIGLVEIAALAGMDALETQRGAAAPVIGIIWRCHRPRSSSRTD